MDPLQKIPKRYFKIAGNILFYGALLFFIFNANAKSWVMQQLVSTGLFNAEITKEGVPRTGAEANIDFSFTDVDGKVISTASLRGKVVFINFWASWCPPCRAEMPSVNELYNKLKNDERYVFIFLNKDEDKTKAKEYIAGNHLAIPLQSSVGDIPTEIYTGSLPTTIILDKVGKIVLHHVAMANYNSPAFIEQLQALL